MALRIEITGESGEIAGSPAEVLRRLVAIAKADGADPSLWVEEALAKAGATGRRVEVLREPRLEVVREFRDHATRVYERAMRLAHRAVMARLELAARSPAARQQLRDLLQAE